MHPASTLSTGTMAFLEIGTSLLTLKTAVDETISTQGPLTADVVGSVVMEMQM